MKHYFLIAKEVGDLTRIFCASLEAKQVKDIPVLSRVMGRFRSKPVVKIPENKNFQIESGRLALVKPSVFKDDPVNLLRLFSVASIHGAEIHPDALKTVRKSLSLIDKDLCNNVEANALFLDMLVNSDASETLLRMMNEAGVLGRFIPEFGKVVAMTQFNMYHHYTVDEHLIRAVGILAALEKGGCRRNIRLRWCFFQPSRAAARSMSRRSCTISPRAGRKIIPLPVNGLRAPWARAWPFAGRNRNNGLAGAPTPADERDGADARSQ